MWDDKDMEKDTLRNLIKKIIKFRNARKWKQFHNPKDLAISLSLEASEVLEHFQWRSKEEVEEYIKNNKNEIGKELADVFYWVLLISHDLKIDIIDAFNKKMEENNRKYSVKKAKGNHIKYNKL